jgi:organic hydroperoxide reductase OsmC/OhrA
VKDLAIELQSRPGALAEMGEALGRAGLSIEGGGAWVVDRRSIAHFLFDDGDAARRALEAANIRVLAVRDVLVQRLDQERPGQLGEISRRMAQAGINIEVMYSDHDHQLILVVDDVVKGRVISEAWMQTQLPSPSKEHTYTIETCWTGNDGKGTDSYKSYRRDHTIRSEGKSEIPGSSDPAFCGDPTRYNPEELMVASLSACHMLWYLHLCSANHICVLDYRDAASGVMRENADGSGEFVSVRLKPAVTLSSANYRSRALALHNEAHRLCFMARSVKFPVEVAPQLITEEN